MEQSSSRLYAGPLSQAALKILAALRAQNLDEGRRNQPSSNSHRQMERCDYSQVQSWTPSSCSQLESKDSFSYWPQMFSVSDHNSTNETESHQASPCSDSSLQKETPRALPCYQYFQRDSHRLCPEPPAYLSSRAPSFSPETEESSCQHNTFSFSLQLPDGLSDHQTAPCSSSAGILKPAFMLDKFPDVKGPDEMFPSTKEQLDCHSVACPTLLLHSDKQSETVNLSSVHNEDETIWDIGANEAEGLVPSGRRVKWTKSVCKPSQETGGGVDKHQHSELNTAETKRGHLPPIDFVTKEMGQTVAVTAERGLTEEPLVQSEAANFILEDNNTHNLERFGLIAMAMESRTELGFEENIEHELDRQQLNCFATQVTDLHRINTDAHKIEEVRHLPKSAEGSEGERCLVPTLSLDYGPFRSDFRPPYRPDNQQHHACLQTNSKSDSVLIPESTQNFSLQQNLIITTATLGKELFTKQQTSEIYSLTPSSLQKRKYDVYRHQCGNPPLKSYKTSLFPMWEPPRSSQRTVVEEGGVSELKKIGLQPSVSECPTSTEDQQTQTKITPFETGLMFKVQSQSHVLKQAQPNTQRKVEKSSNKMARIASKQKPSAKLCKHRLAKLRVDPAIDVPQGFHELVTTREMKAQSKIGLQPTALTSDARIKDSGRLNLEEREQLLKEAGQAEAVILTMMYQDGTTQLDHEQKLAPPVCGLLMLMKNDLCSATPRWSLGLNDSLVYLKLEHNPPWAQLQVQHTQQPFTRDMLLHVLSRSQLVVCYKAKDFLRTVLLYCKQGLSLEQDFEEWLRKLTSM